MRSDIVLFRGITMSENNNSASIYVDDHLIEVKLPSTPLQILEMTRQSNGGEYKLVGARVDGEIVDLTRPLPRREAPYKVEFIDTSTDEGMEILRHSTSHLMTQAVKRVFGEQVQLGVGPATKYGFY